MTTRLEPLDEDWTRALALVAHPDDMEYGAAAAVARWTDQGRSIVYVLVTDGEAGIPALDPAEVGPLRRAEQTDSCAVVGVHELEFLGLPDGLLVEGLQLRAALAGTIRRHRPEVVLSVNHRDSWGGPTWNHSDHRAVGRSLLDAVRDAANPWVFPEEGEIWEGVRFLAFGGSPEATHGVDVTDTIDRGVASLECHRVYLDHLAAEETPEDFLRAMAAASGARLGTPYAAVFEVVHLSSASTTGRSRGYRRAALETSRLAPRRPPTDEPHPAPSHRAGRRRPACYACPAASHTLGRAITRPRLQAHDGSVTVTSDPGKGTTVTV